MEPDRDLATMRRLFAATDPLVEPSGSIWDVKVGFEIPVYGALAHGGVSVAHYSCG